MPDVYCTPRFVRSYHRASPVLKRMAEGATHDAVRACRSDVTTWLRRYDRIAGVTSQRLIEIDIGGGPRMIAEWTSPRLTLVDMGDHEVVPRIRLADLDRDLADAAPAPPVFDPNTPADFFSRVPDAYVFDYGNELGREWLYQLDEQQGAVLETLMEMVEDSYLAEGNSTSVVFVTGGPGTGKTSILVNLADYIHTHLGLSISVSFPSRVLSYVIASTARSLPWDDFGAVGGDVLLVDDPKSLDDVVSMLKGPGIRPKVLVASFDPLQLGESLEDERLDAHLRDLGATSTTLTTCYRQKENVGLAAMSVMQRVAESTPYLDQAKIADHQRRHARVTDLANGLTFVNPHGYTEVHESDIGRALAEETMRIFSTGRTWEHWPSLLIGVEGSQPYETVRLTTSDGRALDSVLCGLDQASEIKGLEFPHVFVIICRETHSEITAGFKGSGRRRYDSRRLLRIPFSRARDSIVVFVTQNPDDWQELIGYGVKPS